MTNNEAIKNVMYMRDSLDPLSERKLIESLDVAINALKLHNGSDINVLTTDAINRQAIMQMFNSADRYVAKSLRLCDTDKVFPQNEVFIVDDMYEGLEQLWPVKPKTGNWDITIDKRGLKCAICSSCGTIMYAGTTKFCPECGADMRNNHKTN